MPKLSELRTLLDSARTARDLEKAAAAPPRKHDAVRPSDRRTPPDTPREPAPPSASVPRKLAASKHAEGDIDLGHAFADVHRMPPGNRAVVKGAPPTPIPAQRIEDERAAFEMSKYGEELAPLSWDIGQEPDGEQTYLRRGLGTDVLVKLKRGHWAVQAELDLHGHTARTVRDTLADFLLDARSRRYRCVRVIHGKGLTSPNREPVLKGRVRRWLVNWDDVLAYTEAPAHGGGGGAVLVLLRGA